MIFVFIGKPGGSKIKIMLVTTENKKGQLGSRLRVFMGAALVCFP